MSNAMAKQINEQQLEEVMMNYQVAPETWMGWNTYNGVLKCPPNEYTNYQYLKEHVNYVDKSEYIQGPSAAAAKWSDQCFQRINPMEVLMDPWQPQETCTTEDQPSNELLDELNQLREAVMKLKNQAKENETHLANELSNIKGVKGGTLV